jgi:hypothetical protein
MLSRLGKWVPEVNGHDHLASPKPDISGFWLQHILNRLRPKIPHIETTPKDQASQRRGLVIARDG